MRIIHLVMGINRITWLENGVVDACYFSNEYIEFSEEEYHWQEMQMAKQKQLCLPKISHVK